jgi:hypothetical protein
LYSKFGQLIFKLLEKNAPKQWTIKTFKPGCRRAATSRASTRHARAPGGLGVRATRRPRPPAARGSHLPMRRTPRLLGVLPGPRAPAEVAVLWRYLRHHRDVTGGASPIKTECHALLAPSPPLHCARHCLPPVNSPPRPPPVRPTFLAYSLGALETGAAIRCSALHIPHQRRSLPRAPPPAVAARPRRSCPRSNPGLPRALGEHVVVSHRLPGRERGRLTRIRPAPPPPMVEGPNCESKFLSRGLVAKMHVQ